MARYSTGCLTTAGSTTLPIISLYATASVRPKVREIGVFNTTTSVVALKLARLSTSTGTQGAGLVETPHAPTDPAALATGFNTHSVAPGTITDLGYRTVLGSQIGSGMVWTFSEPGLVIEAATTNGIGIVVENGTGVACQAYIVWDE